MILSKEQFYEAKNFMKTKARPLDRALFEFYFESSDQESVAQQLQTYQNNDGGFGNAIEADFRLPASSPMATTVGLQYAREIKLEETHDIIQQSIRYLLESYNEEYRRWQAVPIKVNDFPRAPWWNYNVDKNRCGVEEHWANPNAEIVGYLNFYRSLVPKDFLKQVNQLALTELDQLPEKIEMHDFMCYQYLLEYAPESMAKVIYTRLRESLLLTTSLSPKKWGEYGATPLQISSSPDSTFYDKLKDGIDKNLDFVISSFTKEGCWNPNWSWFGQYDEQWPQAEKDWKGYLTVRNLITLKSFNRIEGVKVIQKNKNKN